MDKAYYVEYESPNFVFKNGAWIVRDGSGKYIKDFVNRKNANEYADKLNYSIGIRPVIIK